MGGDSRQLYLYDLLLRDGHRVTKAALSDGPIDFDLIRKADCVLLPMPLSGRDGALFAPLYPHPIPLPELLDSLSPGQILFGGKVDKPLRQLAEKRGLTIHDYLLREELAIANAVPTAEGALQLAMEALPTTIHQSRVLIVGFGRVGQCTALRFHALGAEVTVCARNPGQRALAESLGCAALPLSQLAAIPHHLDLLINTVPTPVLGRAQLEHLGSPLLLELASPPGGFDSAAVQELGLRLISAPGLPGKVAPATAAHIIQTTVYHMLQELNR